MTNLALNNNVLENAVAVFVKPRRVRLVGVYDNLPFQPSVLRRVGADIVHAVPLLQVLLHRLAIEEHHGDVRVHRAVNRVRGVRAVHEIDAEHVVIHGDKPVDLLVLVRLVLLRVRQVYVDPDSRILLVACGNLGEREHHV